ncbi:MAG: disulfide bond formation protein B [Pseudomonadota bacterium]
MRGLFNYRLTNFYCFILISFLVSFGYYLQYFHSLPPCPLCVLQRIIFVILALIFLLASMIQFKRAGRITTAFLTSLFSFLGLAAAARQVWLQHLPASQVPACIPDLQTLFSLFPFKKAVGLVFRGGVDCATVHWRWLGLSIPEWSLIFFIGLAIVSIWQLLRK